MSGPATEPPFPADNGNTPSSPDSAPWSDTDLGLAPGSSSPSSPSYTVTPKASAPVKTAVATDQLSTIGHIGRYALKYQIGEGGLGRVFAAHDPLLSRLIAIKTLNLEVPAEDRESFHAMFLNEARAAGGLSHPHIVTVFDAGVSEQGPYIAMELLRGRDLRQLRLEGWRPTAMQAATVVRRVADALAYAHSKGVVHRDIKPANIFMVGRTQPRVLDFGIARIAHQHDAQAEGDVIGGSPYYMSPEQIRHETVDRRADVFSLGVVLYELLTDARPFRGGSLSEITEAVLKHQPPPAHELDPKVPKGLSDIAAKAMEKNPDDRFRSARALSRELRHWLDENPRTDPDADEPIAAPKQRKRVMGMAAAAATAVVVAAAAWWGLAPHSSPSEAAPAVAVIAPTVTAEPAPTVAAPALLTPEASAVAMADPVAAAASASTLPSAVALAPSLEPLPATATPAITPDAPAPTVVSRPAEPKERTKDPVAKDSKKDNAKEAPKETAKQRRTREAKEREAKQAANATTAAPSTGTVRIAVSPWGQVEVDGKAAGTAPPLTEIKLSEGRHTITLRNDEFPPHSVTVNVTAGQPVNVKHRFGS